MQTRVLTPGLEVGAIGLGCMGMSEFYGEANDADSIKVIHAALDRGVTMLDTADMYGSGHNEELVGRAIRGRRDGVVIATKFGIVRNPGEYARSISGRPEYVKSACEASLKRLGIDTIDLYYQHRRDFDVPVEETVGAMAELVNEGKVRYLGMSEMSAETLKKASAVHPIAALQSEYSLWSRDIEGDVMDTCRKLGIGIVAYSPLGRGFLTGKITSPDTLAENDFRRISPRMSGDNFDANLEMVEQLKTVADRLGCSLAQLAIAWVMAKGDDIVPIPGTKKLKYLEDNLGAEKLSLDAATVAELEKIVDPAKVQGMRYPEEGMKGLNG